MIERRVLDHRGIGRVVLSACAAWSIRLALWRTYRWRQALFKGLVSWMTFAAILIASFASFTEFDWSLTLTLVGATSIIVPLGAVGFAFMAREDRKRLVSVIRRCRQCDYPLVGSIDTGRCPECALPFRDESLPPEVESIDPSWPERAFRQVILLSLAAYLTAFLFPLTILPSYRSRVRGEYPEGSLGMATLVFMRFVLPILICVSAWFLIRLAQRAAYARFTRPERLIEFLACGRCPACLGDLLGVAPDPADGCRVCPKCGGAWRLPLA